MSSISAAPTPSAFDTSAPTATPSELRGIIRDCYGMEATATLLTSERDLNVHIAADDGGEYVLKIANRAEDPLVTQFQNRALQHIALKDSDVPVPAVIPARDGAAEVRLDLRSVPHVARLLTYVHGVPLHRVATSPRQRRALGTTLGRLTRALKGFDHPLSSHEILWDLKNTQRLEALTVHIADETKRAVVDAMFDRFRNHIHPRQGALRSQVVHNDFNPHNVLMDPVDHGRVAGVLDFGDMVLTPVIYDVAVACSYQLPEDGHPLAYAADFVSAYHAVNPLLPDEIDLLFDLIGVRNAMTVTITEWRAGRYPENSTYILRNNPRASRGLERLRTITREDARQIFRRACGFA